MKESILYKLERTVINYTDVPEKIISTWLDANYFGKLQLSGYEIEISVTDRHYGIHNDDCYPCVVLKLFRWETDDEFDKRNKREIASKKRVEKAAETRRLKKEKLEREKEDRKKELDSNPEYQKFLELCAKFKTV